MTGEDQQMNAVTKAAEGSQVQTWDDRPAPQVLSPTPMTLLDRAVAQGADITILERLMALQERWEASQARKSFDEAIASARAEIKPIAKNRHVGFDSRKPGAARTYYRHEDLAEVARTVDAALSKNGLSYRWRTTSVINEPIAVTCIISHRAGHSEENTLTAGRDDSGNKNSIQAIGSTLTYLQRYTLKAALGLAASNDDDGKATDSSAISDEQFDAIRKVMLDTSANEVRFCEFFAIEGVADLPAARFDEAMTMLRQAHAKREAKKASAS